MSLEFWNPFSLFVLVVSMSWFYTKCIRMVNNCTKAFLIWSVGWYLVTPIGLTPVAIPVKNINNVWINVFWHYEIFHISVNDILTFFVFLISMFYFVGRGRIPKVLFYILFSLLIVFVLGSLSLLLSPEGISFKNYFSSVRGYMLLLSGLFIGGVFYKHTDGEAISEYMRCVAILFIVWVFVLLLLASEQKTARYWMPALLTNQAWQSFVFMFSMVAVFYNKHALYRGAAFLCLLVPVVGVYKSSVLAFLCLICFYSWGRWVKIDFGKGLYMALPFVMFFIAPFLVYLGGYVLNIDAIATRWFQLLNMVKTLWAHGLFTTLFGIGFGQWYHIYFPFPFVDYGAWTPDQLNNESAKFSVQIPFFSLVRGVGLVGVIVWLSLLSYISVRLSRMFYFLEWKGLCMAFLIVMFYRLSVFPEALPSDILLLGFVISYFLLVSTEKINAA